MGLVVSYNKRNPSISEPPHAHGTTKRNKPNKNNIVPASYGRASERDPQLQGLMHTTVELLYVREGVLTCTIHRATHRLESRRIASTRLTRHAKKQSRHGASYETQNFTKQTNLGLRAFFWGGAITPGTSPSTSPFPAGPGESPSPSLLASPYIPKTINTKGTKRHGDQLESPPAGHGDLRGQMQSGR